MQLACVWPLPESPSISACPPLNTNWTFTKFLRASHFFTSWIARSRIPSHNLLYLMTGSLTALFFNQLLFELLIKFYFISLEQFVRFVGITRPSKFGIVVCSSRRRPVSLYRFDWRRQRRSTRKNHVDFIYLQPPEILPFVENVSSRRSEIRLGSDAGSAPNVFHTKGFYFEFDFIASSRLMTNSTRILHTL
jgi:hypothetical protein